MEELNMVKVEFSYGDGTSESVIMTDHEATSELQHFLNRYPDAGKKQWMAKMKGKDITYPWSDTHYYSINEKYGRDNGLHR
jgi:hypothetical protein